EADRTLGYDLSKVCFEGPSTELDDTAVAQPAVLGTSVAILEALVEAVNEKLGHRATGGSDPRGVAALPLALRPRFVAGHSLGEFTALVAAGVLTFQEALRLVAERRRLAASHRARACVVHADAALPRTSRPDRRERQRAPARVGVGDSRGARSPSLTARRVASVGALHGRAWCLDLRRDRSGSGGERARQTDRGREAGQRI